MPEVKDSCSFVLGNPLWGGLYWSTEHGKVEVHFSLFQWVQLPLKSDLVWGLFWFFFFSCRVGYAGSKIRKNIAGCCSYLNRRRVSRFAILRAVQGEPWGSVLSPFLCLKIGIYRFRLMARSPPFSSSNIGEFAKINTTSSLFHHFASNLSTRFFGAERVTFLTNPTFPDLNSWLIFSPAPKEEHLLR